MNSVLSNATPPTPSGTPGGRSTRRAVPSGDTQTGGRWPAEATFTERSTGSNTAQMQVANWPSPIPVAVSSRRVSTCSGGMSSVASVRATVRSCPIVAAARIPWPITSPTTSATRPQDSGTTSNQSPPTSLTTLLGR